MPRRAVLLAALAALALPASSAAQGSAGGSQLTRAPNSFGCETKPTFTEQSFDGYYRLLPSGTQDCTWWQVGDNTANGTLTGAVPGDGRITSISVHMGQQTAQLRFVILRLYADAASGNRQCCFFVTETPPVTAGPGITSHPVNLPVERNTNPLNNLVTQDYVGVSGISGAGPLPLFGNGSHNVLSDYTPGNPAAGFLYPRMGSLPGDGGGGRREEGIPGVEVLMRWSFCPAGAAPGSSIFCPGGGGGGGAGGELIDLLAQRVRAANGRVPLRLRCLLAFDCVGRVTLRTRGGAGAGAAKARVVGTKRLRIGSGKTKRVRVKLNRRGRKLAAKRKKLPLSAVVDLGAAGRSTLKLSLRRKG